MLRASKVLIIMLCFVCEILITSCKGKKFNSNGTVQTADIEIQEKSMRQSQKQNIIKNIIKTHTLPLNH